MRRSLTALLGMALMPALALTAPTGAEQSKIPVVPAAEPQSGAQQDAEQADEEWRGLWVDAFNEGIYSADEVSDLVTHAQELGANALVVQIGRRFDCFRSEERRVGKDRSAGYGRDATWQ